MTPVRLALVGFGKWARNYVALEKDAGVQVVGIVTRDGEQREGGPNHPHFFCSTIEHCYGHCDAVIYAGHPSGAVEATAQALRLGMPILIEKPAGLSLADAERIQYEETFARYNPLVLVGHQHLFAEGFEALRSLYSGGQLLAIWGGPGPVRDFSPWWDYGPHGVACGLALLGSSEAIWNEGDEYAFLRGTLTLRSLRGRCSVDISNDLAEKHARISWYTPNDATIRYDAYGSQAEPPLTRQVRAFAEAVRAGGTDDYRFGARWAVDVAKALEAVPEYARSRRRA